MTLASSPEASEAPVLKSLRTSDFGCIGDCLKKKDPFTSPPDCCSFISSKISRHLAFFAFRRA